MEAVSFNVADDFVVKIGKEQEGVVVPRLLFRDASRVLVELANAQASQSTSVLEVLLKARSVQGAAKQDDGPEGLQELSRKAIADMMVSKHHTLVARLLSVVSSGAITEEHIGKMQNEEAIKLAAYLIDQNFASLGNLSASLNRMNTSGKQKPE